MIEDTYERYTLRNLQIHIIATTQSRSFNWAAIIFITWIYTSPSTSFLPLSTFLLIPSKSAAKSDQKCQDCQILSNLLLNFCYRQLHWSSSTIWRTLAWRLVSIAICSIGTLSQMNRIRASQQNKPIELSVHNRPRYVWLAGNHADVEHFNTDNIFCVSSTYNSSYIYISASDNGWSTRWLTLLLELLGYYLKYDSHWFFWSLYVIWSCDPPTVIVRMSAHNSFTSHHKTWSQYSIS